MKLGLSNRNYFAFRLSKLNERAVNGHIEKRFALFRPKYVLDFMGWRAEGDFMGWDYDVYEACSAVVHVHKTSELG